MPKLGYYGRLLYDSPLIEAGTTGAFSSTDMDLESRSPTSPDIGADEFVDTDSDNLADTWEQELAGGLGTLTSATQDQDSDGLTNYEEQQNGTDPTDSDTDDDGASDGAEIETYGTDPLDSDTDDDDMPDGWEIDNGLNVTTDDAFEDEDGDRYPNIYEYAGSTDPDDDTSIPADDITVDVDGGGDHTTLGAALSAATTANGMYQIIGIEPGTYTDSGNFGLTFSSSKPKLLVIGKSGAYQTVFDAEATRAPHTFDNHYGWSITNTMVISSLTIKHTQRGAIQITSASDHRIWLTDMILKDNPSSGSYVGAVNITSVDEVHLVGCALIENESQSSLAEQLYINSGDMFMTNTVVYGSSADTMLYVGSYATLTASYSLVKGYTLSGTGNLAGTTDPKLRFDERLLSDSPLRGAGAPTSYSRRDFDLETRPSSSPDIGVDQWVDSDTDGLPDSWELIVTSNLTTLTGTDADSDGLTDYQEYATFNTEMGADPLDADTDDDLVTDGEEITYGTDPLTKDSDDLCCDANNDGLLDAIGVQLGYQLSDGDDDGDGVSNATEVAQGTDPIRTDTDGDTVPDGTDVFPLDPNKSSLDTDPNDTTGPVITLIAPKGAVKQ